MFGRLTFELALARCVKLMYRGNRLYQLLHHHCVIYPNITGIHLNMVVACQCDNL